MNNKRRKQINKLVINLEELKEALQVINDDEEEYLDNFPENLQESERYYKSEEIVDSINEIIDDLDSASSALSDVIEQ